MAEKDGQKQICCPLCGSTDLTEPVDYASYENHARFPRRNYGTLKMNYFTITPDRARICLDCGYFLLFINPERLEEVRSVEEERIPAQTGKKRVN